MIRRILAIAATELSIALRNRWILIATSMMVLFSVALTLAGSAPTGSLGVDLLTVAVASMTTLSVYLVPLLALLLAFDGIAGEVERGGLALLLTYPVSRGEVLLGKTFAHLAALIFAVFVGFGTAGALAWYLGGASIDSLLDLARLPVTLDRGVDAAIKIEQSVIVFGAFEIGWQNHQRVCAEPLCMARAFDDFIDHQRRRLADQVAASSDAFGAELKQAIALFPGEVRVLAGTRAEHQPMHTAIDVNFN